jgi:GH24 family phage-related lysozyme (muramidase)
MKKIIALILISNFSFAQKFTSTQQYQILCWVVKKAENYSQNSYYCEAEVKTIGWGFTKKSGITSVKDIKDADIKFRNLIQQKFNEVNKKYPNFSYLQKAVIVSLMYNCGNFRQIEKSDFFKHLTKGNLKKSIREFKEWNKIYDKKLKRYRVSNGLVNRRNFESKLLNNSFNMQDYLSLKTEVENIYKKHNN